MSAVNVHTSLEQFFCNTISINGALDNLPLRQNKLKLCLILCPPRCPASASTFIPWGAEDETLWSLSCQAARSSRFMVTLQVSSVLGEHEHEVFLQSGVGFIFLSLSGSFLRTWLWKSAKNTGEAACQCLRARQQNSFRHPLHKGTHRTASSAADQVVGVLSTWQIPTVAASEGLWSPSRKTYVVWEPKYSTVWFCEEKALETKTGKKILILTNLLNILAV